jgi:multidrug transporter EmrE-like cation transporter
MSMATFAPSVAQAWPLLVVAGLPEIGSTVGMRSTQGFATRAGMDHAAH